MAIACNAHENTNKIRTKLHPHHRCEKRRVFHRLNHNQLNEILIYFRQLMQVEMQFALMRLACHAWIWICVRTA